MEVLSPSIIYPEILYSIYGGDQVKVVIKFITLKSVIAKHKKKGENVISDGVYDGFTLNNSLQCAHKRD